MVTIRCWLDRLTLKVKGTPYVHLTPNNILDITGVTLCEDCLTGDGDGLCTVCDNVFGIALKRFLDALPYGTIVMFCWPQEGR